MKALCGFVLLLLSLHCTADEAPAASPDPALERRVMQLSAELRCLVCQNQSLADSNADLAIDLKNQVRSQLQAGKSEPQIREYMVARYGDFVLYDPPFKASTLLLWAGPFALLLLGLAGLVAYMRRRHRRLPAVELTAQDHARAEALLRGESGHESR